MYVPILIGSLSLLQQFRPYFRKYISDKMNHHEYIFINSLFICAIICIYLVFLVVTEKTTMTEIITTYKSLTLQEIGFLTALSVLTVISGVVVYELDKNINTPFLNSIYFKVAGMLALFAIGVLLFKETYKTHQIVGIGITILGIYLMSMKNFKL